MVKVCLKIHICPIIRHGGSTTPSVRNYPAFYVWSKSNFQILTKHIGKTIKNYQTKYMQYENIFYDNYNDGYFIL
jgi:hypothetical protein